MRGTCTYVRYETEAIEAYFGQTDSQSVSHQSKVSSKEEEKVLASRREEGRRVVPRENDICIRIRPLMIDCSSAASV